MVELLGSGNTAVGSSSALRSLGGTYSVILPVAGSTLPILPAASANQTLPCLSTEMPTGVDPVVGISYAVNRSPATSNLTILFACTTGIHRLPLPSIAIPDGTPLSGIVNLRVMLLAGS